MRYQKYPVCPDLRPFVECYYVWEGTANERMEIQSPPNVFCAIVFNLGDPYFTKESDGELKAIPRSFVSGQLISNYTLVLRGSISMFGIVFKPSALHNFFGFRMSTLVNSRMALSLLLNERADILWKKVKEESDEANKMAILENFVLELLPTGKSNLTLIDEAIEYIDLKKGVISVDDVAKHLNISRRYLEKKFLIKVGVSPKFYARMKRFAILSLRVAYNEKIDWQQIVVDYGFHDQSHLAKEFMEFNQMNPSSYHTLNQEMTRHLKLRR